MCVGDLVTWKPDLPFRFAKKDYGIIVEILDEYLVGVLWCGYSEVYLEPIRHLEVVYEKIS
jgi:hypothetical protein